MRPYRTSRPEFLRWEFGGKRASLRHYTQETDCCEDGTKFPAWRIGVACVDAMQRVLDGTFHERIS